jgi:hypothetical protein
MRFAWAKVTSLLTNITNKVTNLLINLVKLVKSADRFIYKEYESE